MASSSKPIIYWRVYFLLALVESAGFLFILLKVPSEGLSIARFILLGILTLALLTSLWALFNVQNIAPLIDSRFLPRLMTGSALLTITLILVLFLLRYSNPEGLLVYYDRAAPPVFFLLCFSIQSVILFALLQFGFHADNLQFSKPVVKPFLFFFISLISCFILVSLTKLGITPDPAYWGEPGVPIFFWQLFIVLLIASFFFVYAPRNTNYHPQLSYILPLSIYLIAIILWLSVPVGVLKTGFYASIDPPTFQPFPYSDAGYYDWMAHSLLIGHPYQGDIPTRPLYIVFLALLHLIFGENYKLIIVGQTCLLGLIPVVFYYVGKLVHSRSVGVLTSLLFIFREFNTILVSSQIRVSNSKTLLVDLPTLLFLSAACLFVLLWFKAKTIRSAVLAGGSFGLLLLLRTQSMLLLPFIFLVAYLHFHFSSKVKTETKRLIPDPKFLLLSVCFLLSFICAVTPWLAHNYLQTGKFTFDAPFQYKMVAALYTSGNLSDQASFDLQGRGVGSILLESALKDPKFVFGFISNHFLAGEVDGLLALPLIKPYNGIFQPIHLYWTTWNGSLEWYNVLLLVFYLMLIALGLAAAWKYSSWVGLVPLFFNIGYTLATSIGRFSGWRYDLPADWVIYFYFCIGIVEGCLLAISFFKANLSADKPDDSLSVPALKHGIIMFSPILIFVFLGTLPWLAEGWAAPRYADQTFQTLSAQIVAIPNAPKLTEMEMFATQSEAFLQIGRVLYPRFYIRNDGASSTRPWPAYETRDFPRLGFLLLNQNLNHVVFATRGSEAQIPQAADAIVLGCKHPDYVDVRLIALPQTNKVYISAPLDEPCVP